MQCTYILICMHYLLYKYINLQQYSIINTIYQIQIIKKNVICNTIQSGAAKYCCLIERIYISDLTRVH